MKMLLWSVVAAVGLAWTGAAWLVATAARWVQQAAASGAGVDWAVLAGQVQLPSWLTWWFDAGWLLAVIDGVVQLLQLAWTTMPWLGTAVGWVAPLTWVLWGAGMLLLLLAAAIAHWAIGRIAAPPPMAAPR